MVQSIETPDNFRVVALLTVRNEEQYLERCLQHLYEQGIETYLIDNQSTDRTLEIAQRFLDRGVFAIDRLPYRGFFDLETILCYEEQLAKEIDADWFIHHNADEIREAPAPFRTLKEGIQAIDQQGYNAINFEEFIFVPTSDHESYEAKDYVQEMRYYYFFAPWPNFRLNAWKKTSDINLVRDGGHRANFENQKIAPTQFILRHYIILSKQYGIKKYSKFRRSLKELNYGWGLERTKIRADRFELPDKSNLKFLSVDHVFDRSNPQKEELLFQQKHPQLTVRIKQTSFPIDALCPLLVGGTRNVDLTIIIQILEHSGIFMGCQHSKLLQKLIFEDIYPGGIIPFLSFWEKPVFDSFYDERVDDLIQSLESYFANFEWEKIRLWGWGEPANLILLPFFHQVMPRLRFLHLVCDGRNLAVPSSPPSRPAYESLLLKPYEKNWSQSLQSIILWQRIHQRVANYGEQQMGDQYLRMRFEDWYDDPENIVSQLKEFLYLEGDLEVIIRKVLPPQFPHTQWQQLDLETQFALHQIASPLLERLGYPVAPEYTIDSQIQMIEYGFGLKEFPFVPLPTQDLEGNPVNSRRINLKKIQQDLVRSRDRLKQIQQWLDNELK